MEAEVKGRLEGMAKAMARTVHRLLLIGRELTMVHQVIP